MEAMADDVPLLGVPTPGEAPPPPPAPSTWSSASQWALALTAGLTLLLLGWRGYGLSRWSTRPGVVEKGVVPLAPMDLNCASETELANIPGLGPTLAARIVEHRQQR